MAEQQKQTKAIATLRVDEALRSLDIQRHWVLERGLGARDNWQNNGAVSFSLTSPLDDLNSAAALAFPDRITDLSSLFNAASAFSKALIDFESDPWHAEVIIQAIDMPEAKRNEYRRRGDDAVEAARKFMEAWGKAADLAPDIRTAA